MMKEFTMRPEIPSGGALDFSYLLDPPAGKYGIVQIKDGHFCLGNGKRIRFFGTNLSPMSYAAGKQMARVYVDRLAKAGVNMIRIHATDKPPAETSLIDYTGGNSLHLNMENLDKFDYMIAALKDAGIYSHIDLMMGRHFHIDGDSLDFDDTIYDDQWPLKHIEQFNPRMIALQKEFATMFLTHVNPYTGNAYVDEPAVAIIQITNENSTLWKVEHHNAPSYDKEIDGMWNKWLLGKYGSREKLDEAWTDEYGVRALGEGEDPAKSTVLRPEVGEWMEKTVNYWDEYTGVDSPARFSDNVRFLNDKQWEFGKGMYDHLRALGVKCAINYSNHPKGAADNYGNTLGDVLENNAYWNHPERSVASDKNAPMMFHRKRMIETDPRETLTSLFEHNVFSRMALVPSENKPFVITEWNATYPTGYYADAMLLTTAYALLNDWDGMLLFAYGGVPAEPEAGPGRIKGCFGLNNDPGTWGQFGICSAIFQDGLIRRGKNSIDLAYTAEDIFSLAQNWMCPYGYLPFVSRMNNVFLMGEGRAYKGDADVVVSSGFTPTGDYTDAKHALVYSRSPYADTAHKSRGKAAFLDAHRGAAGNAEGGTDIMVNAAWQRVHKIGSINEKYAVLDDERAIDKMYKVYSEIVDQCMKHWGLIDPDKGLRPTGKIISDTGEMEYAYRDGYLRIDTDRIQAYIGRTGFREAGVGRFSVKLDNEYMTVSFFSKDGKSLDVSGHVLMQMVGAVENSGMVWDENKLLNMGQGPVLIDQAQGELYIGGATSVTAYVLDAVGNRAGELPTEQHGDAGAKVILDAKRAAISYELIIE